MSPVFINFAARNKENGLLNMISMYRKKEVLNYYILYGYRAKKIRSVMRREGKKPLSLKTIRKDLNTYDDILRTQGRESALEYARHQDTFQTPPRERTKLDGKARDFIESCIRDNERKKSEGNRKQCMDMQKVWDILKGDMGYGVCYSTVTAYARDYRARLACGGEKVHECFIRQWHPAGEECQFDWGEVKLCIAGRWMKLRMAAFALPHSNHRRGYLFIREHTLAFQEAHRNYFHDIGHIPVRMVYDNMRVAVKSFVGSEKHPTDALLDLSNFYGLEWRFCNARRGNEKGTVEETVKVLRKEAFSVKDHFDSIGEAQAYLDRVCEKLNRTGKSKATAEVARLAEEDFAAMRPCTDDFGCFQLVERKVNNYGVITVGKAYYSVPDRLTLQEVKVRDYTNKIEVLEKGTVVAAHEKTADGLWKLTLEHYLTTLSHKPGAVRNAEALRQAPDGIRRLFSSSFETCPKDFVELLLFAREKGKTYEDVEEAYDRLRKSRVSHVTLELMKQALLPEAYKSAVTIVMIQQDGATIVRKAEEGLMLTAQLMDEHLDMQDHDTGQ